MSLLLLPVFCMYLSSNSFAQEFVEPTELVKVSRQ